MKSKKRSAAKKGLVKRALLQKRVYSIREDQAILAAMQTWAEKTTGVSSYRREDLLRDKLTSVQGFFSHCGKHPFLVRPRDCLAWRRYLEKRYKRSEERRV